MPTGWYFAETGTNQNSLYSATDASGASISGDTFSLGSTGMVERAFGVIQSSSLTPIIGARVTNNSGAVLTQLPVQYVGEQWRLGTSGRAIPDRVDFQYSLNASAINDGAATWVNVDALDFSTKVTTGSVGGLNGNDAANRTSISSTITGLNLAVGATITLRWTDFNASGADDALAVDDVILGVPVDGPPTYVSSVPAKDAIDVAIDTAISVTFSEPVDVTGDWFGLNGCGGVTLTPSAGPASTYTFTRSGPLPHGAHCTLVIDGSLVTDRDGTIQPMAGVEQIPFDVVTDQLPVVTATTPADAAVGVLRSANLSVTFSEPVTAPASAFGIFCPDSAPSSLAFALSSEDATVFVLDPNADLPASTHCKLTVDNLQVTDQDGTPHAPDRDTAVFFDTAAVAPPAILTTVPAKNATNFPPAGDLQVVFDASVTLAPGAFTLVCAQSTGIVLTHANSGTTFVIGTSTVLVEGDSCTLTIESSAVTSGDGLNPTADEVVNFTVASTSAATYWQNVNLSSPAQLRCSVHQTIRNHTALTYTQAWEVLEAGEEDPANAARVLDAYRNCSYLAGSTGDRVGGSGAGATCSGDANERYNREHTWPNSLGFPTSTLAPYTDTHMLYATDEGYNASRGNKPYANCPSGCTEEPTSINNGVGGGTGVYPGNSNWYNGSSYEVWNHRKGDMARAVMYMAIRYEGGDSAPDLELTDTAALIVGHASTDPVAYMGLLSTLLSWNTFDVPDQRELDRNAIVQTYQGNRNPFIDHPEWATAGLFASTQPATCTLNTNAPAANDDSYATAAGATLTVVANAGVLANDTDVESAPLSAQLATNVGNGTLALAANGGFTYTPGGFCGGATSFTYRASDGVRLSALRTATITVGACAGNQPPVANDATFALAENSAVATVVGTVSATDPDVGATLTYSITAGNASGAFTMSGNQVRVANASPLNFEATPQFVLTVTVSDGSLSDTAQVIVNLSNVNEAPAANDATFALAENSVAATVVGTVTGSDPDAGAALTYSITGGNSSGAFAISSSGQVTVASAAPLNFETTPQFVLTVTASDGTLTDTAQITINLTNVNEAPAANDATFALAENSPAATVVGQVVASDVDAGTTLTHSITGGNGSGAFAISAGGQITVANAAPLNFETTPQFVLTVTVSDGTLADTAQITVNLSNVEEGGAIANNDDATVVEENSGTFNVLANDVADPDDGTKVVTAVGSPQFGTTMITAGGVWYSPRSNYCGADSFTYTVNGGSSATVNVSVTCDNDFPHTASPLSARAGSEGLSIESFSVAAGFHDVDGDDLDYSQTGLPAGLTLDVESGQVTGVPAAGSAAGSPYTVVITATDGTLSVQQSFQFTVGVRADTVFRHGFEGN